MDYDGFTMDTCTVLRGTFNGKFWMAEGNVLDIPFRGEKGAMLVIPTGSIAATWQGRGQNTCWELVRSQALCGYMLKLNHLSMKNLMAKSSRITRGDRGEDELR